MFNWFFRSVMIAPIILGILAARQRRLQMSVAYLLAMVVVYDFLFILLLYYLRRRWVG
jgi:hypothetical protein